MNRNLLQIQDWISWPGRSPSTIRTWRRFRRDVRNRHQPLLKCLGNFQNPVLVAGCQRSGTTALARVITKSRGMTNYWSGRDDELDAALILAGCVRHEPRGRYCFQTTYINECYREYLEHKGAYRMVWVLRNPVSVVYSMLYNWGRFAFDELFRYCGADQLEGAERRKYERYGAIAIPRLRRACHSYNAKVSQLFQLHETLASENLLVLDYDALVQGPERVLRPVYRFLDLNYQDDYGNSFTSRSVAKANRFTAAEREKVESSCGPVFRRALAFYAQDPRFITDASEPCDGTDCPSRQQRA